MNLLLDTHTVLWFGRASPQLSAEALRLIQDPENDLFLSIASPWEVGIKISTGKLVLGESVDAFFDEQIRLLSLHLLPVSLAHVARISTLPFHHRDPFDRMLVAQSLIENMAIVSADAVLDTYSVIRLW